MDVTSAYACYCLWGPEAPAILERLSDDDLGFPYLQARQITVAHVPVLAQRVTFVGEYGWELYCPAEYGLTLWDALVEAGLPYGMRPGGYRAIDSMRLEKGYRVWGLDITPETTPYEAGLGFAVHEGKDFLGKEALTREPERTLRCLVLDDPRRVCLGGEPVRVDGAPASRVTSGGYGHRVDASIAYAYLRGAPENVTVGVDGTWVEARVEERARRTTPGTSASGHVQHDLPPDPSREERVGGLADARNIALFAAHERACAEDEYADPTYPRWHAHVTRLIAEAKARA
ncbi:aminomethyltransferase family protein [Nonomuraea dietziae]|uniref:aminomethyltransferase family protein n=1 Tax=Nonomuraea dietziae TaxID=65515 RepID=UPI0031D5DE73